MRGMYTYEQNFIKLGNMLLQKVTVYHEMTETDWDWNVSYIVSLNTQHNYGFVN